MPANRTSAGPLHRRLGIATDDRIVIRAAPATFADRLAEGGDCAVATDLRGRARFDVAIGFAQTLADVDRLLEEFGERLAPAGTVWLGWPAKTRQHSTDCSAEAVEARALAAGFVAAKYGALDAGWTGIRFVRLAADGPRPQGLVAEDWR